MVSVGTLSLLTLPLSSQTPPCLCRLQTLTLPFSLRYSHCPLPAFVSSDMHQTLILPSSHETFLMHPCYGPRKQKLRQRMRTSRPCLASVAHPRAALHGPRPLMARWWCPVPGHLRTDISKYAYRFNLYRINK